MPADTPDPSHGAPGEALFKGDEAPFEGFVPISMLGLPAGRAWLSSLVFHALAVTGMATITFPPVNHVRTEDAKAAPTVLRIGEKLYFVAQVLPRAETPRSEAPSIKAPAPQPAKVELPALAPPVQREAPKIFAPPEVRRNQVSESTVIQPMSPPELVFPQVQPLPSFEVQSPRLRATRQFVVPGRPAPKQVQTPDLPPPPPQLEVARAAPVAFAPRSTLVLPAAPPPSVIDVKPPEVRAATEPQIKVGDPVSILSISDRPVPPAPEIVVPPGNILGRTGDGVVAVAGADAGAAAREPSRLTAEGVLPPGSTPPAAGGAKPEPAPEKPLKPNQFRRPADGQFDAVVVQNTPIDQFPEGRGLLSGRPIYSVYVSLGTAKDWTLYFCVPGSTQDKQGNARVVTLNTVTPVLAPYPTLIERPKVNIPSFFKYVLVYGTVTEAGRFQNLKVVRPTRPEADKALIEALNNWEFRPASREGSKIAVEVLLHVPIDGL